MSPDRTPRLPDRVDLLIAGAGTAGAACALHAAKRGLSVLCLDAGPLEEAGARWVNGITQALFDEADIPRPQGAELLGENAPFLMFHGDNPGRAVEPVALPEPGHLEVDMRLLVERLQRGAREAGAVLVGGVGVLGREGRRVRTPLGEVTAEVIVDASGLAGARLLDQPRTSPRDLCSAAQAVYALADEGAAHAFLASHGASEGDTLCFSGVAGGYSILNVRVHDGEVALLSGSIPAEGHPAGQKILDDFIAKVGFVGERRFGGKRAIPLGRPHVELARGQVAVLGDAARQVFAAHGSGIGAGMVAARMLADEVAHGSGPEGYNVRWQREQGGLFAAYDVFRRFSQSLRFDELGRLFESGLLDAEGVQAGLAQRFPRPDAALALRIGPSLVRAGRPGARLIKTGAKMAALQALYAAYPKASGRARTRWAREVARVCRDEKWARGTRGAVAEAA